MTTSIGSSISYNKSSSKANIAIVEMQGAIFAETAKTFLEQLEKAHKTENIKAIIIRWNSPGGSVGPSQEMLSAILRVKETKKVICSVIDVAASGAYYAALGCDHLIANAGSVTGSIGVIMQLYNLKELYKWAKMKPIIIKAGKLKDAGSSHRDMAENEKKYFHDLLESIHVDFKKDVLKYRSKKLTKEIVEEYADGRVLTGTEALKLGFIDEIGSEYDAIMRAKDLADIKGEHKLWRVKKYKNKIEEFLETRSHQTLSIEKIIQAFKNPGLTSQNIQIPRGVPLLLPEHYLQ